MFVDSPIDPDHLLVLRFRSGDLLAFEALVQKYRQSIINLAERILRDFHEAYDIAQKVFLQAYRTLANFEFACKLSTWLYQVTRNLCFNELRRRWRQRCSSLDAPQKNFLASDLEDTRSRQAVEIISGCELMSRLEQAIRSLPEKQRTAILLCCDRGMSYKQIAKSLQMSVAATKSLIHRVRTTIKRELVPHWASAVGGVILPHQSNPLKPLKGGSNQFADKTDSIDPS